MVPRRRLKHWLWDTDPSMHPWISALLAIDEDRNKKPLVDLLTSHTRLPRAARWHIADLLRVNASTRGTIHPFL